MVKILEVKETLEDTTLIDNIYLINGIVKDLNKIEIDNLDIAEYCIEIMNLQVVLQNIEIMLEEESKVIKTMQ